MGSLIITFKDLPLTKLAQTGLRVLLEWVARPLQNFVKFGPDVTVTCIMGNTQIITLVHTYYP